MKAVELDFGAKNGRTGLLDLPESGSPSLLVDPSASWVVGCRTRTDVGSLGDGAVCSV